MTPFGLASDSETGCRLEPPERSVRYVDGDDVAVFLLDGIGLVRDAEVLVLAPPAPGMNGAGDGTRTRNLLITNQLLYQLSYASPEVTGGRF